MYLEEIDGIIYIDNLPSLSPNMEVSFIKKKFSIFSSSLQLSFAALKLYPTHPNFLGVGGIKLLNSASKIKKMLNKVQKFWRICVFLWETIYSLLCPNGCAKLIRSAHAGQNFKKVCESVKNIYEYSKLTISCCITP